MKCQIKKLSEKCEKYKKNYENFIILKNTFESLKTTNKIVAEDIYEDTIIDIAYPEITIKSCQLQYLKKISKGTMATRVMCDFLFEEDDLKGKNFTILSKEFPDKINIIVNFIISNFEIQKRDIVKIITNKCGGK